jgi:hypothetical protein
MLKRIGTVALNIPPGGGGSETEGIICLTASSSTLWPDERLIECAEILPEAFTENCTVTTPVMRAAWAEDG